MITLAFDEVVNDMNGNNERMWNTIELRHGYML